MRRWRLSLEPESGAGRSAGWAGTLSPPGAGDGLPLGFGSSLTLGWVTGQSWGKIVQTFQFGQGGGITRLGEPTAPSPFTREGIPLTIPWDKLSPATRPVY